MKKEIIVKRKRGRPPGSKDKKKRKQRAKNHIKLVKKGETIKKGFARKKQGTCGVKIVALIVRVNETSRVKIKKYEPPELAPCEELVCRITFEKDGIPIHSIFKEVRNFAEALAYCSKEGLLHE